MEVKGIVADKTYIILNGATEISDVLYYTETYKDSNGKKRKKMHSYFDVQFGEYSTIRFERLRDGLKPHMDDTYAHTLIVYANDSLHKVRENIISIFKKA